LPEPCTLRAGFCAGVAAVVVPEVAGVVAGAVFGLALLTGLVLVAGCVAVVEVAGLASLLIAPPVALSDGGLASEPCAATADARLCEPAVAVAVAFAETPEARLLPELAAPEATLPPTVAAPEAVLVPRLAAPIAALLPALAVPDAVAVACCAAPCAAPVAVPAAPEALAPTFEAAFCAPLAALWPTLLSAGELPLSDPPKPP